MAEEYPEVGGAGVPFEPVTPPENPLDVGEIAVPFDPTPSIFYRMYEQKLLEIGNQRIPIMPPKQLAAWRKGEIPDGIGRKTEALADLGALKTLFDRHDGYHDSEGRCHCPTNKADPLTRYGEQDGALGANEEATSRRACAPHLFEAVRKVFDRHRPFKIYEPCEHQHADDDPAAINIAEFGLTCEEGYLYTVCFHCCCDDVSQTERCANEHEGSCWPCPDRKDIAEALEQGLT